jgi:hypothetical protein
MQHVRAPYSRKLSLLHKSALRDHTVKGCICICMCMCICMYSCRRSMFRVLRTCAAPLYGSSAKCAGLKHSARPPQHELSAVLPEMVQALEACDSELKLLKDVPNHWSLCLHKWSAARRVLRGQQTALVARHGFDSEHTHARMCMCVCMCAHKAVFDCGKLIRLGALRGVYSRRYSEERQRVRAAAARAVHGAA